MRAVFSFLDYTLGPDTYYSSLMMGGGGAGGRKASAYSFM
jgi:hypothetical protein